jgi:hypothetical protein
LETGAGISLSAEEAVIDGEHAKVEEKGGGRRNIDYWDRYEESAHWLAQFKRGGSFRVAIEYSTIHDGSRMQLEVAGKKLDIAFEPTGGWGDSQWTSSGSIAVDQLGVHHVILRPLDGTGWKAVNVWSVRLIRDLSKSAPH